MTTTRLPRALTIAATALTLTVGATIATPAVAQANPTSGTASYATIIECNRQVTNVRNSGVYWSDGCYRVKNSTRWFYTWYTLRSRG